MGLGFMGLWVLGFRAVWVYGLMGFRVLALRLQVVHTLRSWGIVLLTRLCKPLRCGMRVR